MITNQNDYNWKKYGFTRVNIDAIHLVLTQYIFGRNIILFYNTMFARP